MGLTSTKAVRCATPRCRKRRGHGVWGSFCREHAARLEQIRDEYIAETAGYGYGDQGRKPRGVPVCCTVGCDNRRLPPAAYCAECEIQQEAA